MYRVITIFFCLLTLTQTSSFAADINHSKMRRDLDIAEEALKRILQYRDDDQNEPNWLDTDQIQSAYINEYGVVFLIKSSLNRKYFENGHNVKVIHKNDGTTNVTKRLPDSAIPFSKTLKQERLADFLKTYGPTIGQLKGNDKIAIVLDVQTRGASITVNVKNFISDKMNHSQEHDLDTLVTKTNKLHTKTIKVNVVRSKDDKYDNVHGVRIRMVTPDSIAQIDTLSYQMMISKDTTHPSSATFSEREIIQVSIQKKDLHSLENYHIMTPKVLQSILNLQTYTADSTLIKKMDILSGIFDTTLGLNLRSPLETQNQTLGAYIPNLGALFFIRNNQNAIMHNPEETTSRNSLTLTDTLIETLADYGATLRDIKPNEEVIIHVHAEYPQYAIHSAFPNSRRIKTHMIKEGIHATVDYTNTPPNEFPKNLLIRVQKKYLNDYATGKIDLPKLREKITITDY